MDGDLKSLQQRLLTSSAVVNKTLCISEYLWVLG